MTVTSRPISSKFLVEGVFHHATEVDVAQPQMAVVVAADVAVTPQLLIVEHRFQPFFADGLNQSFRQAPRRHNSNWRCAA